MLSKAGYLSLPDGSGTYTKLKEIPTIMNSTRLRKEAYPGRPRVMTNFEIDSIAIKRYQHHPADFTSLTHEKYVAFIAGMKAMRDLT